VYRPSRNLAQHRAQCQSKNGSGAARRSARPFRFDSAGPSINPAIGVTRHNGDILELRHFHPYRLTFPQLSPRASRIELRRMRVGGRKCLFAHCFEWHCGGTVQNASVPAATKKAFGSVMWCGLRPFGNAQTITRCGEPMQLSIVGKNFSPKIAPNRALRAFDGLCDDEAVPLICPTRQVFAQSASLPATACYFAWGCFRYFGGEPPLRGGEKSGLKPHTLARPARGVQRRARSRLRGRAVPAGGLVRPARCSGSGLIIEWQRRKRTLKRVLAFGSGSRHRGCRRFSGRRHRLPPPLE
jgi:hypothetical protein